MDNFSKYSFLSRPLITRDPDDDLTDSAPLSLRIRQAIFFALLLALLTVIQHFNSPPRPEVPKPITPASTREIVRGDIGKKDIIFTFDGGSTAQSSDAILKALAKHHVKGTFFLTGKFVENYPAIVKRMKSEGHEIFSHTYDHPHLTEISDIEIISELQKMEDVLEETIHASSRPYFRPPYGDKDGRVIKVAAAEGYQSVYWTYDARDWQETDGMTAAQVRNIILSNLAPGNIYLMHLGDNITGAILDDVFTTIEAKGYGLVSLTQGL